MKTFLLFMMACVILCSCNNTTKTAAVKKDSINFPFKAKYSINWQPGDEKNALLVLNCLKKYVAGDAKGASAYFADTAGFVADKFRFWGSKERSTLMCTVIVS